VFSLIVSAIVALILQDKGGKNQSQLSMLKYGLKSFTEIFEVMRVILYPMITNIILNTVTITVAKTAIMVRRVSSIATVVLAFVACAYFFLGGTIGLIKTGFRDLKGLFKEQPKEKLVQEVNYFQGLQRAFAETEKKEGLFTDAKSAKESELSEEEEARLIESQKAKRAIQMRKLQREKYMNAKK
jgi:hypothetical protein